MRKILRKSQPNFKHYVRKIETLAKNWFSYIKKRITEMYLAMFLPVTLNEKLECMKLIIKPYAFLYATFL